MGKRKYDSEKSGPSKKNKHENNIQELVDDIAESEQPQKQVSENEIISSSHSHGFDIKHFRKELATKQGQTMASKRKIDFSPQAGTSGGFEDKKGAKHIYGMTSMSKSLQSKVLTQFLQVCLNPDNEVDYLLQYLKAGGNSHEILRQITPDSKKNLTLATPAFHIFHLIILKVQSSLPHMISVTEEACRYFLNTFMPTVEIMISENSGPRHRKIILKLLTSMVTLNPDLGVEVLNQAPLTPKHLQYIVEKSNNKEKDNVRTAFVHFMTSFLVDGHLPLIKALLEKQGLLALVIPGLLHDEADAILMFLNILKKNVIDNNFISKSLKLKTFSHQVLHNIFKLFSWKGPPELSNEIRNESRPDIMSILSDIVLTLFTSHRLGLYFSDPSLGTADANKNQNLYKALMTLKRPWENELECGTILQIIFKCPDLHRAMISVIEQSIEPQHSPIWERTTNFVIKLLDKLKPEDMVPRMNDLSSAQTTNFIRFVTLPVPLLKVIQTNLGKDQTISLYCVKMLVKMLQTLRRYMQILEMSDSPILIFDLNNKLEHFVPKHLPTPSVVVSLIQDVINGDGQTEKSKDYKLPKLNDTDSLIYLVDLLLLFNDIHPALFETLEGILDMKNILDFSTTLKDCHVSLLKFKVVSLWLTLDSSAISLKNPMFKDLFLIMLEVYTSDNNNIWIEAKDTLYKFFKNTSIFEADEDEIHLILYTLRNSKVNPTSLIADIVEYVLTNSKDLTEYVRNQIVHFEISDENSEVSLDKLFNDLMENRSTEDSVFLENKVPSPFIVGCMRFIESNKDAKKHLKMFLSLYVANLLHCNYSPELTEVLIGDSKLDIRSYVASWTGQPMSLPEVNAGKDNVLKNISKSVIDNEDIPLKDIFYCLEETPEKEKDITLNDICYRVNVTVNIDSSELLIWAKYLIFCTVRLTNMKQLNDGHQKKVSDYFECLITIAKKHHMMDVCRSMILTLFKNAHVLKIYKPLGLNKDEANILTTSFLLQVVIQHKDIVSYLNKRHNMLKSYQQKNYNEIVKAFVKINKRKNVKCEHTIAVLDVVGLAHEDYLRVFNHIFGVESNSCIKDDKEPSFVLELLRILIEKYSLSIDLELPQGILKTSMKLYTDLLTSKDVTPNLANLENALTQYFDNKSHQVVNVTEDIFKKFFSANAIRKSTSKLAATLLKHNVKLCNVFRDQMVRPEILSQRELTLPFGNAVIEHFLIANKEFLATIYSEYKSNILKLLEKPHKASQIYISCWKFIQKLILECMELHECKKIFVKNHKFETVELTHIHLIQSVFFKMCLFEECHKKDYFINFSLSMLHILTMAVKEAKEVDVIKDMMTDIYNVTRVVQSIKGFDVEQKDEFQKITDSATWQNFCKAVLKDSLKVRTADQSNSCGPQLLHLLTTLIKLFYPNNHQDMVSLFEMATSHSEFLNVMLSHHSSDIKSRLIEFLYTLIAGNNSVMKSQQIPVYLSAYHATRSPCDRLILTILHYYETNGPPVNEYKPYIFGDSAANHYAVRKNRISSLWAHPSPNQVLNLFEKDVIERTVKNFPVTQKLEYHCELTQIDEEAPIFESVRTVLDKMSKDGMFKSKAVKDNESAIRNLLLKTKYDKAILELKSIDLIHLSHLDVDEGIYDPVFLLSLLSHLLAPGSVASCFKLLRTGLLSVAVMALSSHCPQMRAAAYHVLHRFSMLLETETRHKNDRLFLNDFISTLRHSLSTAIVQKGEDTENLRNPRLPAVDALYLAKALMVSTAPFDPLYRPVNNFFIAKQFVDMTVVPDFLSLFHDSDVESADRRAWILDIIKDGTKTMTDVNVVFKTMCLKMIMDFSSSVLCDRMTRDRILSVLSAIVAVPRAFEILVKGYGLMSWLHSIVKQLGKVDKSFLRSVLDFVRNMLCSMRISSFARNIQNGAKSGKLLEFIEVKVNKDIEQEILVILTDLVQHADNLEEEDVVSYIRIYKSLSKKTIKLLTKKQVLNLVEKCSVFFKDSESVKILSKALDNKNANVLKSKTVLVDDCLFKVLSSFASTYLT